MPEMLKYCGRVLPVTQRADATCAGNGLSGAWRTRSTCGTIRCDGSFHDGCQAACLMYWKEAWLERAEDAVPAPTRAELERRASRRSSRRRWSRPRAIKRRRRDSLSLPGDGDPERPPSRCACANRTVPARAAATGSGRRSSRAWSIEAINQWQAFSRAGCRHGCRSPAAAGIPFVHRKARRRARRRRAASSTCSPAISCGSRASERSSPRSTRTTRTAACTSITRWRGTAGETRACRARVDRLIEESNGEMIEIKSDCILLEGVVCTADYHLFCTRGDLLVLARDLAGEDRGP